MKKFSSIFREPETRWVILLLAMVGLFRLWYCTYNDLSGDEAYYWLWSKHLDASYFSKGPAVAWTIALGTHLAGNTVFGIRWLSVLLSLGTGWQLYLLARRLYSPLVGLWVVIAAAVTPLFALGSIVMTIDPLSVFFWVWSANLFLDALEIPTGGRWILVGFGVGSGFLAKYTNGLELLSFLVFLLFSREHRHHLRSLNPLLSLLTFIVMISPVVWWNDHHHWITAEHLKAGGHLDRPLQCNPFEFLKFLEGQAIALSPLLFLAILIAVGSYVRGQSRWQETYLLSLFWIIFGFYALLSWNEAASLNWPALAYVGGLILAVNFWGQRVLLSRGARLFCRLSLFIAAIMTLVMHETFPLHLKKDPSMRIRGWREFGIEAQTFRQEYQPSYLLANNYELASCLAFYLPDQPQTYLPNTGSIQNQFSYWPSYSHDPGQTILYITDDPINTLPGLLNVEFTHIESVGKFSRTYRNRLIQNYRVWLLSN